MMRLLLCDEHRVFAESLALVLSDAGFDLVAVTHSLPETLAALRAQPVDACVLHGGRTPASIAAQLAGVRAVAPSVEIVLLSDISGADVDGTVARTAANHGVYRVMYKDQGIAEIIDAIGQVDGTAAAHEPRAVPARDVAVQPSSRQSGTSFTERERQVLSLLVLGEPTDSVAMTIGVTRATARTHIQSVVKKLGAHTRVEATATAIRLGLVDAETGEWLSDNGSQARG
jgi:two-component system nitrate/nitrite response regulator NarL